MKHRELRIFCMERESPLLTGIFSMFWCFIMFSNLADLNFSGEICPVILSSFYQQVSAFLMSMP